MIAERSRLFHIMRFQSAGRLSSLLGCIVSLHAVLEVTFALLSQNGWNVKGLVGKWHVLVNMVNFADLALHLCYICVLWQSLAGTGPRLLLQDLEPLRVAVPGGVLAYLMAQWLPQQQRGR